MATMITTIETMNANEILAQFWQDNGIEPVEAARQLGVSLSLVSRLLSNERRVTLETYARFQWAYCRKESPFYFDGAVSALATLGKAIEDMPHNAPQTV